ncbi:TetR/AcrR family transcriptional regulator [Polycladidibacter stylochi]|uniref:TetR/AcrR family transcriptional regulator n=1 Tax=Polycladidibacter stylochi TaxID=1807766 RepID=UPI0009E91922|nr:TetR/AcrR family transcriptional regulator [Pseudovibrio stylochi]
MRPTKRDLLISSALKVFYQNGFSATGMDELAEKVGISKTSIYNHFNSKDELIAATLKLRDHNFRRWLKQRVKQLASTPSGQLLAVFDALEEWFQDPAFKGCMLVKAVSEFQKDDSFAKVIAKDNKQDLLNYYHSLAIEADFKQPAMIARQILILQEGAIASAQVGTFKGAAEDARFAAALLINNAKQEKAALSLTLPKKRLEETATYVPKVTMASTEEPIDAKDEDLMEPETQKQLSDNFEDIAWPMNAANSK